MTPRRVWSRSARPLPPSSTRPLELHVKLGVAPVTPTSRRGAISLAQRHRQVLVRVLVFAKGDKADAAKAAGADYVGEMDLVEKIQKENWFDFDVVVATPT